MENEQETDWQLQRLFVVLFFNALIWFSFFAMIRPGDEAITFLIASGVIGVTSCWIVISHIIICRKKLKLKSMLGLYALPAVFMLAILPFLSAFKPPRGIPSNDGVFLFAAERGPNFWDLQFKNKKEELLKNWNKVIPANKHLAWEWDDTNTLWIYSKFDDIYYMFECSEGSQVIYKAWNKTMKKNPPAGLKK